MGRGVRASLRGIQPQAGKLGLVIAGQDLGETDGGVLQQRGFAAPRHPNHREAWVTQRLRPVHRRGTPAARHA